MIVSRGLGRGGFGSLVAHGLTRRVSVPLFKSSGGADDDEAFEEYLEKIKRSGEFRKKLYAASNTIPRELVSEKTKDRIDGMTLSDAITETANNDEQGEGNKLTAVMRALWHGQESGVASVPVDTSDELLWIAFFILADE
jgi:hypothetical protein